MNFHQLFISFMYFVKVKVDNSYSPLEFPLIPKCKKRLIRGYHRKIR